MSSFFFFNNFADGDHGSLSWSKESFSFELRLKMKIDNFRIYKIVNFFFLPRTFLSLNDNVCFHFSLLAFSRHRACERKELKSRTYVISLFKIVRKSIELTKNSVFSFAG